VVPIQSVDIPFVGCKELLARRLGPQDVSRGQIQLRESGSARDSIDRQAVDNQAPIYLGAYVGTPIK